MNKHLILPLSFEVAYDTLEEIAMDHKKEKRTVLRFHPEIAPITVAVLPLSRNEKLIPMSKKYTNHYLVNSM